jgi:hypothetical protein
VPVETRLQLVLVVLTREMTAAEAASPLDMADCLAATRSW